jgi:hypothetical protein
LKATPSARRAPPTKAPASFLNADAPRNAAAITPFNVTEEVASAEEACVVGFALFFSSTFALRPSPFDLRPSTWTNFGPPKKCFASFRNEGR